MNLHPSELMNLCNFLTNEIIVSESFIQRPSCPIKSPNHQSLATYTYKKAMLEYISNFGYELDNMNPCIYPPAFLEALANYLEHRIREDGQNSDIKMVRSGM